MTKSNRGAEARNLRQQETLQTAMNAIAEFVIESRDDAKSSSESNSTISKGEHHHHALEQSSIGESSELVQYQKFGGTMFPTKHRLKSQPLTTEIAPNS